MKFAIPLPQKRSIRILLALAVIALILIGFVILIWVAAHRLFDRNHRFAITSVYVNSTGFWRGKEKEIATLANITPGITNQFSLDLKTLRARILELEPSIETISVRRELPDTIYFRITERIPRAFINAPGSPILLDSNGVIIRSDRCINVAQNLPVIVGLRQQNGFVLGSKMKQAEDAINLLSLTATECPDIRIASISVRDRRQMICALFYKNDLNTLFKVYFPVQNNLKEPMEKLIAALERIRATGSDKRTIKLLFKDQVVLE